MTVRVKEVGGAGLGVWRACLKHSVPRCPECLRTPKARWAKDPPAPSAHVAVAGEPQAPPVAPESIELFGVTRRLSSLQSHLASHGLVILPAGDVPSAEERRHARIGAAIPDELLGIWFAYAPEHVGAELHRDLRDELARRAAKEPEISAHGIPDGENDPGWPDGTPEHVRAGKEQP